GRVAEPELSHGLLQILDEGHRLQRGTTPPALEDAAARQARRLVNGHPDGGGPVDSVEELAEWDEEQGQDHAGHVHEGQEMVVTTPEDGGREGEEKPRQRDRQQGEQREQVAQETLIGQHAALPYAG